jgi:DNA-binding CsgD family transcriptional regulator
VQGTSQNKSIGLYLRKVLVILMISRNSVIGHRRGDLLKGAHVIVAHSTLIILEVVGIVAAARI